MPTESVSLTRRIFQLPRAAWVICIGMFINKLGNFLSVFLVLFLTAKGYSTFEAGIALGALGFGAFFGNAVGGTVADRIGRRAAIAASMFGTAVFTMIVPFVPGIYLMTALAFVIGFFGQLYRPAGGAILVDTVSEPERIAAFALLRLAINLGMSVGPVLGGILSTISYYYLFFGDALTSLVFGVLVLVLLTETRPERADADNGADGGSRGYRRVFADRAMRLYLLAVFAATYVYTQTVATLPLHVRDVHLNNEFYGILLGINALIIVVAELPLVKFTERRSSRHVMAVGMVLLALGVGLTGVADTRVLLILTVILWTVAEMVYTPVATAFPGMLAPDDERGHYQGAEGIAITLAQTLGPAVGGFVYGISTTAHWLSCGVLSAVGAVVILGARHKEGPDTVADGDPDAALDAALEDGPDKASTDR